MSQSVSGPRVQRVAAGLRARIVGLQPGDALPSEATLAAEYSVSRSVVREALQAMAALQLLDLGNGRRARVSSVDGRVFGRVLDHAVSTEQVRVEDVWQVRRTIELRTVVLAAACRSDEEAGAILDLALAMRAAFEVPDEVMEHDIAFHAAIAGACGNPVFALVVGAFGDVTRQTWGIGWRGWGSQQAQMTSVAGHEVIARAIQARDADAAETAMRAHFDQSSRMLRAAETEA